MRYRLKKNGFRVAQYSTELLPTLPVLLARLCQQHCQTRLYRLLQLNSAELSSARLRSARLSSAQPSSTQLGLAQVSRVRSWAASLPVSCRLGNCTWRILMRRLPRWPGALLIGMPSPFTMRSEPGVATCKQM